MADQSGLASDLLRGAKSIGSDDSAAQRRVYHEQDRWPIFQLDETGVLYALRSRLRAHLEAKSIEKESRIAVAAKTSDVKATKPKRRRRTSPSDAA
jgi:hypothetical protein